eukprot:GEZU01008703.1.p1 GENE.GEZU01008703.1~~GEZU01008703.1.p1  ORF type:complete len:121 (-),score=18.69 GEZU01008703.1:14-376(-)
MSLSKRRYCINSVVILAILPTISRLIDLIPKLTAALKPVSLNIVDESYKHAGHAAMKGLAARETHFLVEIVSDEFKGKTLLQRHKMVNELLAEELRTGVHALSIQTRTPEEEERKKQQQQ